MFGHAELLCISLDILTCQYIPRFLHAELHCLPKSLKQYNLIVSQEKGKTMASSLKFHFIFFREYTKTVHTSHFEDARFSHVSSSKVCSSKVMFRLKTKKLFIEENWGT